ncbi:cenp-B, putative [Pediculus humanus corporis]|uniref:Cenp-B, putative n=1 Tax=Pediculus humanus subsp. corporis TaxID=121224 RepID=E0W2L5_PEDHC|nr:cenp-B, putative [Pediculus humanus corporis]EEB19871.1 cenp-B, putative [Pediculus humanus corporis]
MTSVKRKAITIETKLAVIKMLESGAKKSDVCRLFDLVNSSVGSIWKARDKIKSIQSKNLKKIRRPTHENLDTALIKWFRERQLLNLPVSGSGLKTKAQELAKKLEVDNFECSNGWIDRFKKRYAISFTRGNNQSDERCCLDLTWLKEWTDFGGKNIKYEFEDRNKNYGGNSLTA